MTPFERRLPPEPQEVPPARAALRAWLEAAGVEDQEAAFDVLVVASELVTNGVFHDGGDMITVRAQLDAEEVVLEVTTIDSAPGLESHTRGFQDPLDGGRGLAIVRAFSKGLAITRRGASRVTRCRISLA
jgi:anti-sigma regulatory factor (Ser/Thr protein kinase)